MPPNRPSTSKSILASNRAHLVGAIVAIVLALAALLLWYAFADRPGPTAAPPTRTHSYAQVPCYRCHGDPKIRDRCPICQGTGVLRVAPSRLKTNAVPSNLP